MDSKKPAVVNFVMLLQYLIYTKRMNTPTIDQLKRGLEIAEQIGALEREMASILHGQSVPSSSKSKRPASAPKKTKKRNLSPEGLARIIAAQKKRWSKVKGRKVQAPKVAANKKSGITPAGRAKLAESMKARWAARKTDGAAPLAQEQATPSVPFDLAPQLQPATEETQMSTPVVEELAVV